MNVTTVVWLRRIAQQEARALRHLYRAHGRIPVCAPLQKGPS